MNKKHISIFVAFQYWYVGLCRTTFNPKLSPPQQGITHQISIEQLRLIRFQMSDYLPSIDAHHKSSDLDVVQHEALCSGWFMNFSFLAKITHK